MKYAILTLWLTAIYLAYSTSTDWQELDRQAKQQAQAFAYFKQTKLPPKECP